MSIKNRDGIELPDLENTVKNFLSVNEVVICQSQYYLYDAKKGLWNSQSLDNIATLIAKYLTTYTKVEWTTGYRQVIIEKVKVKATPVEKMDWAASTKICMLNGVYDIEKDELEDLSPEYYFTSGLQINYNSKAKCEQFEKFLKEISCNKSYRKKSLEEFLGLSLVREINGQAFVMVGSGRNGKSVFGNIAFALAGEERSATLNIKELSKFGSAILEGKTFAIISEIDKMTSNNLMTNELKQILTGENMWVNKKYINPKSLSFRASVLILTNHNIGLKSDDTDGTLRRLHIFPAEYEIKESDVDVKLEEKLLSELEGIFLLAIKGYRRLKNNNYVYSSHRESDRYLSKMMKNTNPLRAFVKEKIRKCSDNFITYDVLRESYNEWKKQNGIDSKVKINSKIIYEEVSKQYSIVERKKSNGVRGIKHICLMEEIGK